MVTNNFWILQGFHAIFQSRLKVPRMRIKVFEHQAPLSHPKALPHPPFCPPHYLIESNLRLSNSPSENSKITLNCPWSYEVERDCQVLGFFLTAYHQLHSQRTSCQWCLSSQNLRLCSRPWEMHWLGDVLVVEPGSSLAAQSPTMESKSCRQKWRQSE